MGVPQQLRNRTDRGLSDSGGVADPRTSDSEGRLEITVVFTTPEATLAATQRAAALLNGMDARINLLAVHAVPFPLALDNPPVSVAFYELHLLQIAGQARLKQRSTRICAAPDLQCWPPF